MKTSLRLQRHDEAKSSDRLTVNPKSREWSVPTHTLPPIAGHDFSHVNLFAHAPQRPALPANPMGNGLPDRDNQESNAAIESVHKPSLGQAITQQPRGVQQQPNLQGKFWIQRDPTKTAEQDTSAAAPAKDAADPTKDAPGSHPTLSEGSVGPSVKELQEKLNGQGATPPLKVDGIFGPKTHGAVNHFQATHMDTTGKPLKVDGIVGKFTWAALDEASKPKAAPLAADELILSSDPANTNEPALAGFRTQVSSKIMPWGLGFNPSDVHLKLLLLGAVEKQAVILKWNAAWGTKPISPDMPASLVPIDAKASVAGVHQLAGWGKLASGDQTILNSMLGGETNLLSQQTRDHLRPQFPALSTAADTEQEKTLKGLITSKDALPGVVDEPVTTTKIDYTLTGPTARKDYAFRGKTADAEEWSIEYKDGVKLLIIAPKAPEPGYHNHTVQQAADASSYLPKANRAAIKTILLNVVVNPDDAHWAVEYNQADFHSYMTAGAAGVVTIYPNKETKSLPGENYMRGTMIHETGHTWSYKTWGSDKTKGKWLEWKQAMDNDKVSVSGYAMASIAEDVAETIQIYVSTQGSPRFEEYRQIVPNRFTMLDKEYK